MIVDTSHGPRHLWGWKRDKRAHRLKLASGGFGLTPQQKGFNVPAESNLRKIKPPAFDQLQLGSCVANSTAAIMMMCRAAYGLPLVTPSRLFIYWARVAIEGGDPGDDSGMFVHDAVTFAAKYGACDEALWPYDPSRFSEKPPAIAFENAAHRKALREYGLDTPDWRKACLGRGFGWNFGFDVPQNFLETTGDTGQLLYPKKDEPFNGGHSVYCFGNSDAHQNEPGDYGAFLCGNSWGNDWGACVHGVALKEDCRGCDGETSGRREGGCFWLPYRMFTDFFATDSFTIHEEMP